MTNKLPAAPTYAALAAIALIVAFAALVPAAASARSVTKCADKSFKVKDGSQTTTIPVKAISTEGGVSCASAYKVIAAAVAGRPIEGYAIRPGLFKAPEGLLAQMAVKGNKKIEFAVRGA